MVEALNNPKQEQPKNSFSEERQERRALRHAIKDVYLRRSRGAISRGEIGAEIEKILVDYIIEHVMRPRCLTEFEFSPDLVIDNSGSFDLGRRCGFYYYSSDDGKKLEPTVYKPDLSLASNRQEIIDRIMFYRFHERRR